VWNDRKLSQKSARVTKMAEMDDFQHAVAIARSLGMREKEFAAALGISARHLWRLKEGINRPSRQVLERAVQALRIPLSDLTAGDDPQWAAFPKSRSDLLTTFHEQFRNAKSVLTVTTAIDSYLQEEEMLEWSNRNWLDVADWDAHKVGFYPYARQQTAARNHSNFLHRIVCPWLLFLTAQAESIDWLDRIRFGIGDYEEMTVVTPVPDWPLVRDRIDAHLPAGSTGWTKICVIDSIRVLIHVQEKFYLSSSNEHVVRQLKGMIEQVVSGACPDFLQGSQLTLGAIKGASRKTEFAIEDALVSPEDKVRAIRLWQMFETMVDNKKYVSPAKFLSEFRPPRLPGRPR